MKKRVLVIGDIILDKYVSGEVTRISPEAPIPILVPKEIYYRLGGAANVARNLNSLGMDVCLTGLLGNDVYGQIVKDLLKAEQINPDFLFTSPFAKTTVKERFIGNFQQILRIDVDNKYPLESHLEDEGVTPENLDEGMSRHLSFYDAIVISDYNKGTITKNICNILRAEKNRTKKPVFVDTHKTDISMFKDFDCITPNLKEAEKIVGRTIEKQTWDITKVCEEILNKMNSKFVFLTMAEEGVMYCEKSQLNGKNFYLLEHLSAKAKNVVDVTGCGDTFLASFVYSYLRDISALESAKIANWCAGTVASKSGTETITKEEYLEILKKGDHYGV